jgi:hypothetical protein
MMRTAKNPSNLLSNEDIYKDNNNNRGTRFFYWIYDILMHKMQFFAYRNESGIFLHAKS